MLDDIQLLNVISVQFWSDYGRIARSQTKQYWSLLSLHPISSQWEPCPEATQTAALMIT